MLRDAQQACSTLPAAATSPALLATELAARGHSVLVREARGGGSGERSFRNLSHCFVVVVVAAGPAASGGGSSAAASSGPPGAAAAERLLHCGVCRGGGCGRELIVDPGFRGHFAVPRSTPRCEGGACLCGRLFQRG